MLYSDILITITSVGNAYHVVVLSLVWRHFEYTYVNRQAKNIISHSSK